MAFSKTTRSRLLVSSVLALVVALLLTVAYRLTFFSSAQIRSTDFLFPSDTSEHANSTIIVGIDQRTFRELLPQYGPPVHWPRTPYSRALDALRQAGARVVAFDILFDVPRPRVSGDRFRV